MKKLLLLLTLSAYSLAASSQDKILAAWNFRTTTTGTQGNLTTTATAIGKSADPLAHSLTGQSFVDQPKIAISSNGIDLPNATGNSNGWGGDILYLTSLPNGVVQIPANLAEAKARKTYYEIALTIKSGETVSIKEINFKIRRETDYSPNMYVWTYSVNSAVENDFVTIGSETDMRLQFFQTSTINSSGVWGNSNPAGGTSDPTNSGFLQPSVNLSGITSLQNISTTTTIRFRLYFWNTLDYTSMANYPAGDALKIEAIKKEILKCSFTFGKSNSMVADLADEANWISLNFKGETTAPTPLPVSLTSFKATKQSNSVRLNWATASEKDNSYFNVLRAGEDKKFTNIGKVNANGTSSTAKAYSLIDYKPLVGSNYYQLTQTDLDGKLNEVGEIQHVQFDLNTTSLVVSSGAETSSVKATLTAKKADKATVVVYNISGSVLYQAQLNINNGINEIVAPVNLNKGVYILKVKTQLGETWQAKFVR